MFNLLAVAWRAAACCRAQAIGPCAAILIVQLIGLSGRRSDKPWVLVPRCVSNGEGTSGADIRRVALQPAPIFAAVLFLGNRIDIVLGLSFAVDFAIVADASTNKFRYGGFALSMTGWHRRETGLSLLGATLRFGPRTIRRVEHGAGS